MDDAVRHLVVGGDDVRTFDGHTVLYRPDPAGAKKSADNTFGISLAYSFN